MDTTGPRYQARTLGVRPSLPSTRLGLYQKTGHNEYRLVAAAGTGRAIVGRINFPGVAGRG